MPGAAVGIVSFGSNDEAIAEARALLEAKGIATDYLRVRALPMARSVYDFVLQHERIYVLENNFDGQLAQILRMEIADDTRHMTPLPLGDTLPMTAEWIVTEILRRERQS